MFTLKVKNNRDDVLTLTNNPDYTVYKIEGLSPPKSSINSSINTTTDGSIINSSRVENRNIVIYMTIEGDVEANRIKLYKYFPVKKNITLYFTNGARDVNIEGVVELIECDLFANKQVAQISVICPKPYFKSVNELISNFTAVDALFSFPFSIPSSGVEISAVSKSVRQCILNSGDEETGLIITLYSTGDVLNPIIYDVYNKTQLKLNFNMITSDTIVINTNVGEKSITLIREGVTSNILGYLDRGSEWLTLEAGDNVFTFECDRGKNNLQITFTTSLLYAGV